MVTVWHVHVQVFFKISLHLRSDHIKMQVTNMVILITGKTSPVGPMNKKK